MFPAEGAGLFYEHRVTSELRHFCRSYSTANEVSKNEGTRNVGHTYHDAIYPDIYYQN